MIIEQYVWGDWIPWMTTHKLQLKPSSLYDADNTRMPAATAHLIQS